MPDILNEICPEPQLWESPAVRLVLDGMTESFVVYDKSLRVVFVNRALASFLNLGEAFYLGKTHWELWPAMKGSVVESSFEKALKTGESQSCAYYYPDSDTWFDIRMVAQGEYLHVVFRDITESMRDEQHLEKDSTFRYIIDAIPHIAWVTDGYDQVVHMNARWCEYTGQRDWSRPTVLSTIHPADLETVRTNSARSHGSGQPGSYEIRLRRFDGAYRWHRVRTTALVGSSRWLGTSTDIHEEVLQRQAIEESEKRLRMALHAVNSGVWDFDLESKDGTWSEECWQLIGADPSKPPTLQTLIEQMHPDDRERCVSAIEDAAAMRQGYEVEYRVLHPEKGERWLVSVGSPVDGPSVRLTGITYDITERRLKDQALRESEERYRLVTTTIPQLIWACRMDGYCDYLSQQWEDYTGVPTEDHLGHGWIEALHPDDRDATYTAWMAAINGVAPYDVEYRMRRKDGAYRWFHARGECLRDADGNIVKWFGTSTDVHTERTKKDTLAFLVHLSESTRKLDDPADIMSTVAGLVGRFLSADRCIYAEATDDETLVVVGEYLREGVPGYLPEWRLSDLGEEDRAKMLAGQTVVYRDTQAAPVSDGAKDTYRKTGTHAVIRVPLHKDGRLVAALVVHQLDLRDWEANEIELVEIVTNRCWDAVARARIESQLRALNEELESRVKERTNDLEGFTYSVSHDLRTPLRAISSTSSILKEDFADLLPPEALFQLDRQAKAATKLGQLIDDLLKMSRIGRQEMVRQPIDLTEMALDIASSFKGYPARIEVEEDLKAFGDRRLIHILLENLLGNACKYSPDGGRIRFGRSDGVFSVSDEGIGFDMQYAHKLFLPFERLVRDEEFPGTGIGLANVQRIVERHGGRVWATGEVGRGATFSFTLG